MKFTNKPATWNDRVCSWVCDRHHRRTIIYNPPGVLVLKYHNTIIMEGYLSLQSKTKVHYTVIGVVGMLLSHFALQLPNSTEWFQPRIFSFFLSFMANLNKIISCYNLINAKDERGIIIISNDTFPNITLHTSVDIYKYNKRKSFYTK